MIEETNTRLEDSNHYYDNLAAREADEKSKDRNLEKEATEFANENWSSYYDPYMGDYKDAWCQAYDEFIEDPTAFSATV